MSTLGEVVGGSHELSHNGVTYKISLITQKVKVQFERHLFAKRKECLLQIKEMMDSKEYADALEQLSKDYMAGLFAFEGKFGVEFIGTEPGQVYLVSLLFGIADEQEALRLIKDKAQEVTSLLRLVIKESYAITEEELTEMELKSKAKGEAEKKG
jgi:hypothetical protein